MNSPRNYLLVFLALATFCGSALAWRQHLELIALRADSLSSAERDALQKKILDAQKRQHELEDELAALRASSGEKTAANDDGTSQNSSDDQRQRGPFGNRRAMMNDPNFIKLMALQQKAALDSSYAPLFKQLTQKLALSPAQLAAFQNLLAEKQNAARDVLTAARDQGLNPRTDRAAINQLVAQSNAELDGQIQSTLGPDGFAQYQNYEQTLPQRNTVSQFQQSLSYTSAPLTDSQSQQLIQLLAANAPQGNNNPTGFRGLLGGGNPTSPITDAEIAQASGFLSPDQVAALKNQQATQKAAADLARALRNTGRGSTPAPAGAAPTAGAQAAGR